MFKAIFFIFIFPSLSLIASVQDHFKINPHDSPSHDMRNIDYIYMINLDKRPEKFARSCAQLHPYGIYPFRFSAVNAWEDLTPEIVDDVGVKFQPWMKGGFWGTSYLEKGKDFYFFPFHDIIQVPDRTYFCHCMGPGPIAIVLSHLSVLQDAWDAGFNTVWVMEDDIEIIRNPHIISDLIVELDRTVGKGNWDILFTDLDTKSNNGNRVECYGYALRPNFTPADPARFQMRRNINNNFRKIGARYGAYSMIVRRSGMKKILDHIKTYKIFLPFDMDYTNPNDINLYTVLEDIVSTQIHAPSDNGGPNYNTTFNWE